MEFKKNPEQECQTVLLNFPILLKKPKHQMYYFEVEISNFDADTDIAIGFQSIKTFKHEVMVGASPGSVAIHNLNGALIHERRQIHSFGFQARYGETLGIDTLV
jgi:hypothetical protein